jgi:Zn ribbon nucleic-acid-binding protein
MNLQEKIAYWRKNGFPAIRCIGTGFTGAGKGTAVMDEDDLEARLAKGMKDEEIDNLAETESGEKLIDKYINKKYKEGKHVERMSGGVFNRKKPNGDWSRTTQFDPHTGLAIPE